MTSKYLLILILSITGFVGCQIEPPKIIVSAEEKRYNRAKWLMYAWNQEDSYHCAKNWGKYHCLFTSDFKLVSIHTYERNSLNLKQVDYNFQLSAVDFDGFECLNCCPEIRGISFVGDSLVYPNLGESLLCDWYIKDSMDKLINGSEKYFIDKMKDYHGPITPWLKNALAQHR